MKSEEHTYWHIHDFLKGKLKGEELESFQKEMEHDPSLKEEVQKQVLANQLILHNRLELAKQISYETRQAYKRNQLYKKWTIGVMLLLSLSLAFYRWIRIEQPEKKNEFTSTRIVKEEVVPISPAPSSLPLEHTIPAQRRTAIKLGAKQEPLAPLEEKRETQFPMHEKSEAVQRVELPEEKMEEKKPTLPVLLKKEELEMKNACSQVHINANIVVSSACQGEENGKITLSRFQGGKAPYQVELRSRRGNKLFENEQLPAGHYAVWITDDQHCSTQLEDILVKEVICEEQESVFNPFLGEILELPASSQGGDFIVREKNGNVFYKREIAPNQKVEWNGISLEGGMETGHFIYEILYQNGNRKQGTITITR